MKNTNVVDASCSEWRLKRESIWNEYTTVSSDDPSSYKRELSIAKKVFMGDIDSHSDKALKLIEANNRAKIYALNSPHQCKENWLWMIDKGWAELMEAEISNIDVIHVYSRLIFIDQYYYKTCGWTEKQRAQFFDLIFGNTYNPNEYVYKNSCHTHPLRPISILYRLGLDISSLYTGVSIKIGFWLERIEFCLQSLEYIDGDCFLPQSVYKSPEYSMLKIAWAKVLMSEEKLSKFYTELRQYNGLHPACKNIDYHVHAANPEVVKVKAIIDKKLDSGKFPAQIADLKKWTEAENADLMDLNKSTRGRILYKDPWLEEPNQKKVQKENNNRNTLSNRDRKRKSLLIPPDAERYFLAEINSYIDRALKGGMNDVESTFGVWEDYHQWNKKRNPRITENGSKKTIIEYASLKGEYKEVHLEAFLRLLYPKRVTEIDLDVFGEGGPEKITKEYRSAWSKILKLAYPETDQIKLKLKKEGESWDYEVTTKVAMNNQEQTYYYTVDSDWLDNTLFSDVVHFSEENKLKHRYHYIYNDTRVTVAYLPPSFSDLFEGILQ